MGTIICGGDGSDFDFIRCIKEKAGFSNVKTALIIGFAAPFESEYQRRFEIQMKECLESVFGAEVLTISKEDYDKKIPLIQKIEKSDFVYVCGGNTLNLMKKLRKSGADKALCNAYKKEGMLLTGSSAGAICWCCYGAADSFHYKRNPSQKVKVRGLGLVHVMFAPHVISDSSRSEEAKRLSESDKSVPVLGMDGVAIAVTQDGRYKTFTYTDTTTAYKGYWKNGEYITVDIQTDEYRDISLIENIKS